MKIAITSQGMELDSSVDPRFGRAAYFIIYDTETGEHEAIDNSQNLQALQGAGIQAAEHVQKSGAEHLITGHCGPNAFRTLNAAGVKVSINASGKVSDVIEKFKSGGFGEIEKPDVEGHWV